MRRALLLAAFGLVPLIAGPADVRAAAWAALRARTPETAHLNHALAVEAIMRNFAGKNDDADEWALAGLVHDIDIDMTENDLSRHGIVAEPILRQLGASNAVIHAVKAHDDHTGIARTSRLDHALYCADQTYWLIVAGSDPTRPGKVAKECAAIGLTMPQAADAARTGMRKAQSEPRP